MTAEAPVRRLIEPLGLLAGNDAAEAIARGIALPLAGGGNAYTIARLIEGARTTVVEARDLPDSWRDVACTLAATPPAWAGLGEGPIIMGILNVTPDSFSDGGDFLDPGRAADAGAAMAEAGAGILDIGGESTRPDATPVAAANEIARVVPVIQRLTRLGVPLSIDTRHASVMAAALDAGASIVNDVTGLAHDPAAAALVAARGAPVVLMHTRGTPETMASLAAYDDVAIDVARDLFRRIAAAEQAGISRDRIVVDPGIGFAKHPSHSLEMLRRLPLLRNLGCRILVGASRKSFISRTVGNPNPKQLLPASLAAALFALSRGATILRVHDVAETAQAVRLWQAMRGVRSVWQSA